MLGLLDTGHPGPGLTELGTQQAHALVPGLADERIDAIYTSTLVRTHYTAAPLAAARGLEPEVRRGLHEIEAGALEMLGDRDSVVRYLETVFQWGTGDLDARMPGGPDGHDFFGRFDEDIEAIAASGAESAAVVSHGAAIRVWVAARAVNIDPAFAAHHHLDNTGIVAIEGEPATGWTITSWQGEPVEPALADASAEDPQGEALDEAHEA